jgi:hypothetical protein
MVSLFTDSSWWDEGVERGFFIKTVMVWNCLRIVRSVWVGMIRLWMMVSSENVTERWFGIDRTPLQQETSIVVSCASSFVGIDIS